MSNEPKGLIANAVEEEANRVLGRIEALKDAYIVVLSSSVIANNGNQVLLKQFDALSKNLNSEEFEPEDYFLSILFVDLISEVETFFVHITRAVISEHPKKLGDFSFKLSEIIDSGSVDELVTRAADEYVNKLMYKKPLDYLSSFCKIISIEQETLLSYWLCYTEAKARRDLGVHNRWICNTTYLRKLKEADITTQSELGELMFPTYDPYVGALLDKLKKMIGKICVEITAKHT